MVGTTLPTPLYALYQRRYGFSELVITVIFATEAVGVIAGLLFSGRISDEAGRRRGAARRPASSSGRLSQMRRVRQ